MAARKPKPGKKTPPVRKEKRDDREPRVPSGYKMPERIYAQASPHSSGGVSMFEAQSQIDSESVPNFASGPDLLEAAANRLAEAGFEVLQVSALTINIAGSRETYEKAFNTRIVPDERRVIKPEEGETTATFLDSPDTEISGLIETKGTPFEDVLEGVALEEPRYFMGPSMYAPLKSYWHLRMPGDVSLATNADRAHRAGLTGLGIKVAMVDSGWFKHPYFVGRGYRVSPVVLGPGAIDPLVDSNGHGTAESANIFAVAPDVQLLPVKINFVNSIGAFNAAVGLNPHIITCSWGSDIKNGPLSAADQALAAAVAAAVAAGIVVIFSAGNGHFGFPGQHPDVISAGGVFMKQDETLRASDYASGFLSNVYPGRRAPDLCGLVGMKPKAAYIMLPLAAGSSIDVSLAGGVHPNGDETASNDGWAAISGTSAAAPQLAGAAALVRQACSKLKPAEVRDVLMKSARDVTSGNCNTTTGGHAAVVGPDLATGTGLVDAHKAAMLAKLRCLVQPILPIQPIQPPIFAEAMETVGPITPVVPVKPVLPIKPIKPIIPPIKPIVPIKPIKPIIPIRPIIPIKPIEPIVGSPKVPFDAQPAGPGAGAAPEAAPEPPAAGSEGGGGLTAEHAQALEDLLLESGLNLDDEI